MAITLSGDSPNLTSASLTTPTLTSPTFAGTPSGSIITSMTAQASTSGTSIDFTSIPSWVKRVTVLFNGVSTSGASEVQIQIGTSGGIQNTTYLGTWMSSTTAGNATSNATSGFLLFTNANGATSLRNGVVVLNLLDSASGIWSASGTVGLSESARISSLGGSKALSGTLDRVRITTVNGTDTFDAGSINILYE